MSHAAIAILLLVTGVAVSAVTAKQIIPLCHRLDWLDYPTGRHQHSKPVPRLGGIAIFLGFAISFALSFALPVTRYQSEVERLALMFAGAGIVMVIMTIDDLAGLGAWFKLGVQALVAAIVVLPRLRGENHGIIIEQFNAPLIGEITLPLGIAIFFSIVWFVGMMNTMNWIDGLDGLATSVTLVLTSVLFLHTYFWPRDNPQFTISLLPLCIAAAAIGFLPFNWNPARIILGDGGANLLGFLLACASIIGGAKIATTILALGLPILDVAWVISYRLATGRSPLEADRGHLHHRLLARGWTQRQIVLFVVGVSMAFGALALALPSRGAKLVAMAIMGIVLLATVSGFAAREAVEEIEAGQPDNRAVE